MNRQGDIAASVARQIAVWLLLCALLLRGLIPSGFKPNMNPADGQGLLVICYGSGGSPIVPGDDADAPADTQQDGICAFALMTGWLPVLAAILVLLWHLPRAVLCVHAWPGPTARQIFCGPPGARAPPRFA